jgi:quercetin dioxygenase-like cupin family protein
MKLMPALAFLAAVALSGTLLLCQSGSNPAVIVNLAGARWTHQTKDPAGSEGVVLREDPQTGGMELLARFPAGHVIAPHWHQSNERLLLLEGRLSLRVGEEAEKLLDTGGFAYLPAREVQRISCVSNTRCTFYLCWDGNPASHREPVAR